MIAVDPHKPIPNDLAACQGCGREDGLDAVVSDAVWARIAAHAGHDRLCLWCMDTIAAELGIFAAAIVGDIRGSLELRGEMIGEGRA